MPCRLQNKIFICWQHKPFTGGKEKHIGQIFNQGHISVENQQKYEVTKVPSLTIKDVKVEDAGVYYCSTDCKFNKDQAIDVTVVGKLL